jgi:hypothetical protein
VPWWGGGKVSPIHLYNPPRGEFDTSELREFLEELSSPLPYAPPLFLSSLWLSSHVWSRASELEGTPHTGRHQVARLPVQTLLLLLLCWTGSRRSHGETCMCEYYRVLHVRHYVVAPVPSHWRHGAKAPRHCGVKFFTTSRFATSASSSTPVRGCNPRERSMRVHVRVSVNHYSITRDR